MEKSDFFREIYKIVQTSWEKLNTTITIETRNIRNTEDTYSNYYNLNYESNSNE